VTQNRNIKRERGKKIKRKRMRR